VVLRADVEAVERQRDVPVPRVMKDYTNWEVWICERYRVPKGGRRRIRSRTASMWAACRIACSICCCALARIASAWWHCSRAVSRIRSVSLRIAMGEKRSAIHGRVLR
jgi:hypothetical protein